MHAVKPWCSLSNGGCSYLLHPCVCMQNQKTCKVPLRLSQLTGVRQRITGLNILVQWCNHGQVVTTNSSTVRDVS